MALLDLKLPEVVMLVAWVGGVYSFAVAAARNGLRRRLFGQGRIPWRKRLGA